MSGDDVIRVRTTDGIEGTIHKGWISESGNSSDIPLRLEDGTTVMVPATRLERRGTGDYLLNLHLRDLLDNSSPSAADGFAIEGREFRENRTDEGIVIPVVVEEPVVHKELVETGKVRITRTVHEREEIVEEPLLREEIEVRRVPVHQVVDEAPKPRTEGDVLIIPILEEVLVVEKRLMLKEELHITRHRHEEVMRERVTLRTQEPVIERFGRDGETLNGIDGAAGV